MMKAGTETGSLMNHIFSRAASPAPAIGMGATILGWTDRHAATVIKVTPHQIHVRRDRATRTDHNGMSERQTYTFSPDPTAPVEIFRLTANGYRNAAGQYLTVGGRSEYYDYSF